MIKVIAHFPVKRMPKCRKFDIFQINSALNDTAFLHLLPRADLFALSLVYLQANHANSQLATGLTVGWSTGHFKC